MRGRAIDLMIILDDLDNKKDQTLWHMRFEKVIHYFYLPWFSVKKKRNNNDDDDDDEEEEDGNNNNNIIGDELLLNSGAKFQR